jgi:DNA-binding GntR family transcriptional regulator
MVEVSKLYHPVYKHVLGEIMAGRLAPGHTLRETDLAALLKVSRTPIREALRKLAADGLVELRPNRSAVVRRLGPEQLGHIYQVREALEGMACELACGRLTAADLARLEELAANVRAKEPTTYHTFDVELHRLVAARSGNPVLAREIAKFHDLVQLVRARTASLPETLELAHQQHLGIVAALKAGDATAARQAMIDHIRSSREVAVKNAVAGTAGGTTPSEEDVNWQLSEPE